MKIARGRLISGAIGRASARAGRASRAPTRVTWSTNGAITLPRCLSLCQCCVSYSTVQKSSNISTLPPLPPPLPICKYMSEKHKAPDLQHASSRTWACTRDQACYIPDSMSARRAGVGVHGAAAYRLAPAGRACPTVMGLVHSESAAGSCTTVCTVSIASLELPALQGHHTCAWVWFSSENHTPNFFLISKGP